MINYIWMSFKAYLSCYHLLYTQAHRHVGLWALWPSFYGPQSPQVQLGPNLVFITLELLGVRTQDPVVEAKALLKSAQERRALLK